MKRVKHDARDLTDEVLSSAREGNKAALTEVFRAAEGLVRWRAGTYPVDADTRADLVSIGHLAVFDAVRTYRPGKGQFLAWMTQWVHARMWTSLRTQSRHREYLADFAEHQHAAEAPADASEQLETDEASRALRRAINGLRPQLREVASGRLEGLTLEAIGKRIGISREMVRRRELQAVERLRVKLQEVA